MVIVERTVMESQKAQSCKLRTRLWNTHADICDEFMDWIQLDTKRLVKPVSMVITTLRITKFRPKLSGPYECDVSVSIHHSIYP
jgi:hypothetical protein